MADNAVVHIGENSPEQVAFKLLVEVALAEEKKLFHGSHFDKKPDRAWILDTYAECLKTVRGFRTPGEGPRVRSF